MANTRNAADDADYSIEYLCNDFFLIGVGVKKPQITYLTHDRSKVKTKAEKDLVARGKRIFILNANAEVYVRGMRTVESAQLAQEKLFLTALKEMRSEENYFACPDQIFADLQVHLDVVMKHFRIMTWQMAAIEIFLTMYSRHPDCNVATAKTMRAALLRRHHVRRVMLLNHASWIARATTKSLFTLFTEEERSQGPRNLDDPVERRRRYMLTDLKVVLAKAEDVVKAYCADCERA